MRRLATERALAAWIVVFCLLVAGCVVVSAVAISNTNALADRTTNSLCALRHGLEDQVRQTDRSLRTIRRVSLGCRPRRCG